MARTKWYVLIAIHSSPLKKKTANDTMIGPRDGFQAANNLHREGYYKRSGNIVFQVLLFQRDLKNVLIGCASSWVVSPGGGAAGRRESTSYQKQLIIFVTS